MEKLNINRLFERNVEGFKECLKQTERIRELREKKNDKLIDLCTDYVANKNSNKYYNWFVFMPLENNKEVMQVLNDYSIDISNFENEYIEIDKIELLEKLHKRKLLMYFDKPNPTDNHDWTIYVITSEQLLREYENVIYARINMLTLLKFVDYVDDISWIEFNTEEDLSTFLLTDYEIEYILHGTPKNNSIVFRAYTYSRIENFGGMIQIEDKIPEQKIMKKINSYNDPNSIKHNGLNFLSFEIDDENNLKTVLSTLLYVDKQIKKYNCNVSCTFYICNKELRNKFNLIVKEIRKRKLYKKDCNEDVIADLLNKYKIDKGYYKTIAYISN